MLQAIRIGILPSLLMAAHLAAQTLPTGFSQTTYASALAWPTRMAFAPDGRLFILEQAGNIRVVKNGALLSAPFVRITTNTSIVSNSEEGLLGLALDPGFAGNGYLYVYYSVMSPFHQRISRFKASGDTADAAHGEVPLLNVENGSCHCGGALEFGPDGKLYAGIGDSYNGPNSQLLNTLKGKIIRMNPVPDSIAQIPTDNPFYGTATGRNRLIWAMGLRNPFSMAFQLGTGKLYINDVGLSTYEEINDGVGGRNFGWPTTEGPFASAQYPAFSQPVLAYQRSGSGPTIGGLIVGGAFYNPSVVQFPQQYVGKYFFSDYSYNGWVRQLNPVDSSTAAFVSPGPSSASFLDVKVGPDGALYYLNRAASGSVMRVSYSASQIAGGVDNGSMGLTLRRGGKSWTFSFFAASGPSRLDLFDASGRLAANLVRSSEPGLHSVAWDASGFAGGVYEVRLQSGGRVLTRRLALVD